MFQDDDDYGSLLQEATDLADQVRRLTQKNEQLELRLATAEQDARANSVRRMQAEEQLEKLQKAAQALVARHAREIAAGASGGAQAPHTPYYAKRPKRRA